MKFVIFLLLYSLRLQASPLYVSLAISIVDGRSISKQSVAETDALITSEFPDYRRIQLSFTIPILGIGSAEKQHELRARIKTAIKREAELMASRGEKIKILNVSTHGASNGEKTILKYLGEVSESSVDANFDHIFADLKFHFAPDANVVLDSCSTFFMVPQVSPPIAENLFSITLA